MKPTSKMMRTPGTFLFRAILALLVAVVLLPACSDQGGSAHAESAVSTGDAVATIDGKPVSLSELEELAAPQLQQLEAQKHKILESTLDQLIENKLLEAEAAKRELSVDALVKAEVDDKIQPVTDADVDTWYEQNQARLQGQTKEALADRIKQFLEQQRGSTARGEFIASLRDKYTVKVLFEPIRADVEVAGAPTKGPDSAPVTIIEFSDFQCPFCSRVNPTLAQVRETYGDKVRIAFRQFPLAIHPNAQKAAEASLCAHDQGKFWQMHDAMFSAQQELAVEQLKAKAASLELDSEQFNSCLDSGKYADRVAQDMAAGQAAGVSGTPAMFVNGRLVSGAVPFEQIKTVIDDELARKGSK